MCLSEPPEHQRYLYIYRLWIYLLDYIFWKDPIPLQHMQFQKEICTFLSLSWILLNVKLISDASEFGALYIYVYLPN